MRNLVFPRWLCVTLFAALANAHACEGAASAPQVKCTCAKVEYPQLARRAEAQGTTGLEFTLDANGKVSSATVVRRSGWFREHRLLDQVALQWLTTCTFQPALSEEDRAKKHHMEYVWRLQ
ncbi:MAG: TonB family protein [Burkholderiaceae bacterium]|nr:TonB family protein [Burkholderiaceae bacterium]